MQRYYKLVYSFDKLTVDAQTMQGISIGLGVAKLKQKCQHPYRFSPPYLLRAEFLDYLNMKYRIFLM